MSKATKYVSHQPDEHGNILWSAEENAIWKTLVDRQMQVLPGRACHEFMQGLEKLALPHERIPQLHDVNEVLQATTGWRVTQVPSLINFDRFFALLANKEFPVATFIRTRGDLDYLQEPDIWPLSLVD